LSLGWAAILDLPPVRRVEGSLAHTPLLDLVKDFDLPALPLANRIRPAAAALLLKRAPRSV
jgi:hypothetical protein